MPNRDAFPAVFAQLREIFVPFAPRLVVTADAPDNYALSAPASTVRPDGFFFGAVQLKKSYVSYHLMPVYVFPDLLDGLPDGLRKRMQGTSCFNFTRLDAATLAGLERLTEAGFTRYERERLLAAPNPVAVGAAGLDVGGEVN